MSNTEEHRLLHPIGPINHETLVIDPRDALWPAEMVQHRLNEMKNGVSTARGTATPSGRRPERSG
ncbi:MAG: hypothetical protein ACJ8C4_03665 [Gemmataceae bacterium]